MNKEEYVFYDAGWKSGVEELRKYAIKQLEKHLMRYNGNGYKPNIKTAGITTAIKILKDFKYEN